MAAYGCDGAVNPALGARGGHAGGPSRHLKRGRDGAVSELPSWALVRLEDGERIISITCGGGGYGPPFERDPELVRKDVLEGWISRDRGRDVYGVVLTDDFEIDLRETQIARSLEHA